MFCVGGVAVIVLEFSDRPSLPGGLVKLATGAPVSHVDFVLDDGSLLGATPSGGVGVRDWTPGRRIERYAVEAPADVLDLALSQVGKPYDLTAALGLFFRRDWRACDSWICSELVAWAFREAGAPLLRAEHLARVTPRDLLLSPRLRPLPFAPELLVVSAAHTAEVRPA